MSKEAEAYFRSLMGLSDKKKLGKDHEKIIADLEKQLAIAKTEQLATDSIKRLEQEEQKKGALKIDIEELQSLRIKRDAGELMAKEKFLEKRKYIEKKYKLNVRDIVALLEGRRQI